jgi:hypothetical protein
MKLMQLILKAKIPRKEVMAAFEEAAPAFAAIKGLTWKIWLENKEDGTISGLYYFKDGVDLEAYKASEMYKNPPPVFEVISSKTYNVLEDFSKVTRAPL